MSTKTFTQLVATTVAVLAMGSIAQAGRGGSAARIQNAINTNSVDAIIAEIERSEKLICDACIAPVMGLLDDDRYAVREAAAWWFAKRPVMKSALRDQSILDLEGSDSRMARNAADVLGTFRHPEAVDALSAAAVRSDLSSEARAHAVRALGTIGVLAGNDALESAMTDTDSTVRFEALTAWIAIRGQADAGAAVVGLVDDADATVRAKAAAVVGELRDTTGRVALEQQLASDDDPMVRRNAAWALGRIGDRGSLSVLETASDDPSSLVRLTARAAIYQLD